MRGRRTYSGIITEAQIQAMIYTFGIHIETKMLNDEIKPKSEGIYRTTGGQ
jgi:hypothetical protein